MRYPLSKIRKEKNLSIAWLDLFLKEVMNLLTWINANFIKLSPNTITILSVVFGLISGYFFLISNLALGAVFYLARYICDWLDGKTARLTGRTSDFGAFLDNYSGIVSFFLISLGLSFGQYFSTKQFQWLVLGPVILFLFQFRFSASLLFALRHGLIFRGKKDQNKSKSKSRLILRMENLQKRFMKYELVEPFNLADMNHILFFVAPLVSLFYNILDWAAYAYILILLLKEIFWFVYYRHLFLSS